MAINQTVTASVYLSQLTDVGVLARGSNLGAANAGFYSLVVDRSGQVVTEASPIPINFALMRGK